MKVGKNSLVLALAAVGALASTNTGTFADGPAPIPPVNDAPNPYTMINDYFKLPEGRKWGSTSTIDIDKDGKSIWVAERCGGNSCLDAATGQIKDVAAIMKYDETGKLVTSFGNGLLVFPHGMHVDRDVLIPKRALVRPSRAPAPPKASWLTRRAISTEPRSARSESAST